MTPVLSRNISAIGYDEDTATLWVRFNDSLSMYVYDAVPASVHERLMAASSKGAFLARMVKGVYRYRRVG